MDNVVQFPFTEEEFKNFMKREIPMYSKLERLEDEKADISFLGKVALAEELYFEVQEYQKEKKEAWTEREHAMVDLLLEQLKEGITMMTDPEFQKTYKKTYTSPEGENNENQ